MGRDLLGVAKRHLTQIFALLRGCKWIVAFCLIMSLVLFLPAQIRELYRIALADRVSSELASLYIGVTVIALALWIGALVVARASLDQIAEPTPLTYLVARLLPPMLAAMPLLASAAGHYRSRPRAIDAAAAAFARTAGSPWENYDLTITKEITPGLVTASLALALGAAILAATLAVVDVGRPRGMLRRLVTFFSDGRSLALTAVAIAGATWGYLVNPVPIATGLGVFGLLAVFTLSISAATTHLSVLTLRHNFPYLPSLLLYALAISAFDLNDNHSVRAVPPERSAEVLTRDVSPATNWQFEDWYRSRPDLADYPDGYPVYIVAAQGGGIYAAYQTAIFLARLEDVCPSFRHHLFAISAVSGGSLGAAAFAVSLPSLGAGKSASGMPMLNANEPVPPCPALGRFLDGSSGFTTKGREDPGRVEQRVRRVLSQDFLSPLVASSLFPDLAQRFLFFPVPYFDRAWALEQSFERAAQVALGDGPNLMEQSYLSHWTPSQSSPALLLNTTNAASGARVVITPIALETKASAGLSERTVTAYPFWPASRLPERVRPKRELGQAPEISLSTAVGISARFPWLTPAASVDISDDAAKTHHKIRLVDGGYVDNSGIDTALDLMQDMTPLVEALAAQTGTQKLPNAKVQLIVLGGGGLSVRDSFGFGEFMEPVRGLLSTRQSRAYAAVERAATRLPNVAFGAYNFSTSSSRVVVPGMQRELLANPFYDLPLGWSLSARSRDIIERQSGRYWECVPDEAFHQSEPGLSEADCMQVVIYHQLNRSLAKAAQDLAILTAVTRQEATKSVAPARLDHQKLIRCYRDKSMPAINLPQNRVLDSILTEWDRHPEWKDERWLAYILGTIFHESGGLQNKIERMDYGSAATLSRIWPSHFDSLEKAGEFVHNPEALANEVYGGRFGNTEPGDGWRYRGRGLLQITGRAHYKQLGQAIGVDLEAQPELMIAPSIAGRVAVDGFVASHMLQVAKYFNEDTEDWINVRKVFNGGLTGAQEVATRSKAFMECIKSANR